MTYKPFLYSQNNPTWAHDKLGNSHTSTIGRYGCALVSLAMVAQTSVSWLNTCRAATGGFEKDTPPKYRGAYQANWDIYRCAPNVKLAEVCPKDYLWTKPVPDADMQKLYDWLDKPNTAALVEVDWRGDAAGAGHGNNQHFVVATDHVEQLMHINDPWDGVVKTLTPRYGSTNAKAIWRYILYSVTP